MKKVPTTSTEEQPSTRLIGNVVFLANIKSGDRLRLSPSWPSEQLSLQTSSDINEFQGRNYLCPVYPKKMGGAPICSRK
jgi:hypothetical protein